MTDCSATQLEFEGFGARRVVDCFEPENVIVTSREKGASVFRRLDKKGLSGSSRITVLHHETKKKIIFRP